MGCWGRKMVVVVVGGLQLMVQHYDLKKFHVEFQVQNKGWDIWVILWIFFSPVRKLTPHHHMSLNYLELFNTMINRVGKSQKINRVGKSRNDQQSRKKSKFINRVGKTQN